MSAKEFLENLPRWLKSPKHKLHEVLFEPALKKCKLYRRNTAWFRHSAIGIYAPAMRSLIDNDCKIEMLVSLTGKVDKDVIMALEKTKDHDSKTKILLKFGNKMVWSLAGLEQSPDNWDYQHHLLVYLLATKKLEIRFAISRQEENDEDDGFFHEKAGYMLFEDGHKLAFIGNFNESYSSIVKHGERTQVFRSTREGDEEDIDYYINDITEQWENDDPHTDVYKLSKDTLEAVKRYSLSREDMIEFDRKYHKKDKKKDEPSIDKLNVNIEINIPTVPTHYKGNPFIMGGHQTKALNAWANNDYQGILEHATGSGKTITAIYGLCRVAEDSKRVGIISVPYQSLADQWVEELKMFNLSPIKCYEKFANWGLRAEEEIARFKMKDPDESFLLPIVVVNKTLHSEKFQKLLKELNMNEVIYVADECHRYAKIEGTAKLPPADYRLGLSATPFSDHPSAELANLELKNFFGGGDSCDSFTIADAMRLGVLCKYEYHPIPIHLNEDEYDRYLKNAAMSQYTDDSSPNDEVNMGAISEMNRALGSAAEKFEYLRGFIQDKKLEGRAIIFCGDGSTELESQSTQLTESESRDRDKVREILVSEGVLCNNFTAEESSARRKEILKAFEEGDTKCLISIRVLDEGIDVPGVETAVILASSRNRRQFVQRRGRVLRKAEGKTLAKIYDFICLPPRGNYESKIVDGEIKRLAEMSDVCVNRDVTKDLIADLASKYSLQEETKNLIKNLI